MYIPIEQTDCFKTFVAISDWVWERVGGWDRLAQDTVGKQIIRAVDSIGANMVEGEGRYSKADSLHFFVIARASAHETCYWLERAATRNLISQEEFHEQNNNLRQAAKQLNAMITHRRNKPQPPNHPTT